MRILLGILCGIMVLFGGGCAIVAAAAGPVALVPAGIATLNVLVLIALFGTAKPVLWAFTCLPFSISSGCLLFSASWQALGQPTAPATGLGFYWPAVSR